MIEQDHREIKLFIIFETSLPSCDRVFSTFITVSHLFHYVLPIILDSLIISYTSVLPKLFLGSFISSVIWIFNFLHHLTLKLCSFGLVKIYCPLFWIRGPEQVNRIRTNRRHNDGTDNENLCYTWSLFNGNIVNFLHRPTYEWESPYSVRQIMSHLYC